MAMRIITGNDLSKEYINTFNVVIRAAYSNETSSLPDPVPPEDIHFFLEMAGGTVAVGRYAKVEGIKIGEEGWHTPVWGRSFIAVLPEHWGEGYGKELTKAMIEYGVARNMSQVGIHGKKAFVAKDENKPTLSDFYKSCGLEVNEELGKRFYAPKNGELRDLSHTNISYVAEDPFIEKVQACDELVYLPYSW